MEIFQLLDKSNCQKCGEKTCLAFAGAVFRGRISLVECPKLDRVAIKRFSSNSESQLPVEDEGIVYLKKLKKEIGGIDLVKAAERIGARVLDNRLTLKVFGKDFGVDSRGNLYADIHINPWVAVPFLNYIIRGKGVDASGNWVSFRELKDGKERYLLFKKRCEEAMKRVADVYTGFFDDLVHLFGGRQVEKQFESDISVVLHPLPKIPIMVCYWLPEEGLESSFNLFFDKTADKNLDIDSIFTLGVGLAQMFGKLALRHGFPEVLSSQHTSDFAL